MKFIIKRGRTDNLSLFPFYSVYSLHFTWIDFSCSGCVVSLYKAQKKAAGPTHQRYGFEVDFASLSEHFSLTNREQEIIALVVRGKTNKEIEKELFISLKTVKSHLYNIYQKLNVQNRLQLMNIFRDYSNKSTQEE